MAPPEEEDPASATNLRRRIREQRSEGVTEREEEAQI
jgi:hypothetical protein